MKFIGIIPARYASTRFPGKPLTLINGKTMIERVYLQASSAVHLTEVIVATDDARIEEHVKTIGGKVIMTSPDHQSGTDRCYEASQKLNLDDHDVVVNIQGDEPYIQPEQIKMICRCFDNENINIATLIKEIEDQETLFNPNSVKVVVNSFDEALYFSRSPLPHYRSKNEKEWLSLHKYYKHIGMYAYRYKTLSEIVKLKQSSLEIAESLEQLRWLENGYKINTAKTTVESISIDVPEDLNKIKTA